MLITNMKVIQNSKYYDMLSELRVLIDQLKQDSSS
jgi:hypothetical protein